MENNLFMDLALQLANEARGRDEVPVGCVVVSDKKVIGQASNAPRELCDPTAHAEVLALRQACNHLQTSRLDQCDVYVTLEPCAMCGHALSLARVRRVFFGAYDPKGGGLVHGPRLYEQPTCLHKPELIGGLQERKAKSLLQSFFQKKR